MSPDDAPPPQAALNPPPDSANGPPMTWRARSTARRALDRRVMTVIEEMSDAFLAFDAEWRITYANRAAAELNGTTPQALVGRNHWEQWPETVGSEVERQYRRALADQTPVRFEHHYPVSGVWHDVRAYPADDGGLVVFYRDMTPEKALEEQRARQARELAEAHDKAHAAELQFRLLVDRVQDYAIFVMDADGVVTHWGQGAQRMKGYRPEEIVGQHLRVLYPEQTPRDGGADEHLRHAAAHGEYIGEGARRRKDGTLFPARTVLTALYRDGHLFGFSKITKELTADRERAAAVRQAMEAAEAASVAKSQFLANTSHEIRTPLNAIIGYTELLELGLAGPLTAQQRAYLSRVQATSQHLLTLVNDVIDLSKIEAGAMETLLEPVRVAEAAQAALQLVEPQARARQLSLVNGCAFSSYALLGDAERVRQVLVNLLSNAVRFTEPGGRITVSCGEAVTPPAGAEVQGAGPWRFIRVEDTGIGIAPDQLERIWEAFVQADAGRTRRVGGSGLGLTISRHLARLMGGDIVAHSQAGVGSSFSLWLPAAPSRDPAATRRATPPDGGSRVEDVLERIEPRAASGLRHLADLLLADSEGILARHVARLRNDASVPSANGGRDSELEDHTITLIADLAQSLTLAGEDGPEAPAMLRDATVIQRVIAQRHGQQRARLGWSEPEVLREQRVLREEVLHALERGDPRDDPGLERARTILSQLLGRIERETLSAYRAACANPGEVGEASGNP